MNTPTNGGAEKRPLVSVAIPAYNAARTLAHTLDSLLTQTYPNIEIVVVDDGSTDSTPDVLRAYGERVRSVRLAHGGLPKARNTGCRMARGPLVALMDADDICVPERIEVQVKALESCPDAVACSSDFSAFDQNGPVAESYGATYYSMIRDAPRGLASFYTGSSRVEVAVDAPSGPRTPIEVHIRTGSIYRELAFGNFVHPPTVLFRRKALEAVGMFDESLPFNCDWECFVRLARSGPFVHVDRALLAYRLSETQMSSSRGNGGAGAVELVQAAGKVWDTDPDLLATASERIRRHRGEFYLNAAYALAERRKPQAARMLAGSLRCGWLGATTLVTALKLVLPQVLLLVARSMRHRFMGLALWVPGLAGDWLLTCPEIFSGLA
jgi:glycosyltransferase involved in cell wall biosynthesis